MTLGPRAVGYPDRHLEIDKTALEPEIGARRIAEHFALVRLTRPAGSRTEDGKPVKATIEKAFGYQGDNMRLPVPDLAAALPFYETVLGFRVLSRRDTPHNSAVLARDQVQIGLAENGGDPTRDGCAFHVKDVDSLFAEFKANGLRKELSGFKIEQRNNVAWKVFYVVAPDGLCYWFGERQAG